MRFHGQVSRKSRFKRKKRKWIPLLIPALLIAIAFFLYTVNKQLTPIFTEYAEVQTHKIASHVISKAISTRTTQLMDVNDVIVEDPNSTAGVVKFNTEIISKAMAEIHMLVESHLAEAEAGNLEMLPTQDSVQFDSEAMESQGGVVFYVPIGQAANIPMLGNLGPKIPIRFHVIGEVHATVGSEITEFGINNAMVDVYILVRVNVQIIVPFASRNSIVEQRIPVAMGLIKSDVPNIYTNGEGAAPAIEVPVRLPENQE